MAKMKDATATEKAYERYKAALHALRELEKDAQAKVAELEAAMKPAQDEFRTAHAELNKALLGE